MDVLYKKGYAYFNNIKFKKDSKTGYYLSRLINNKRYRLHRYVWEFYHGKIDKNKHIHHKDNNKNNNEISNLESLDKFNHLSYHGKQNNNLKDYQKIGNIASKKWHKSKEGIEWHKKNYYENCEKSLKKEIILKCNNCNCEYKTISNARNKFCSNKCKSSYRRKLGVDNEIRKCINCGKEFTSNKYSKRLFCRRSCRNKKM